MENINALIEQCGLGTIEGQILTVSGGLMHKMYKVQTTTRTYAVKSLNPEIMSRPEAMKNYAEAERLEKILEDNGIPVVAALSFDGKKMVSVDGRYYYIFPWQEGKITDFNEILTEQSYKAGEILGRIHSIDAQNISQEEPALSEVDFAALLESAKEKDSVIAPLLEANMQLLENAQNKLNEARKNLPAMRAISNDAEEIKLGEAETENTINRIKYLASIENDICLVLKSIEVLKLMES